MIDLIHDFQCDDKWLADALFCASKEYFDYWLNKDHLVFNGLSRYCAPQWFPSEDLADITIDNESTWDKSPRFDKEDILQLLPIDLNSNLYCYEMIFSRLYHHIGNLNDSLYWKKRAEDRLEAINKYMWGKSDNFFFDYNYEKDYRKKIRSLAAYFTLFHRLASDQQAQSLKDSLRFFETEYGLTTCDNDYGFKNRQWNYPVGWPPLHLIVYQGLRNYGFHEDARRIALKWLNLNYKVWKETGKMFEKYDVVNGGIKVIDERYRNQEGFGWTNAVFSLLANDLISEAFS